MSDEHNEDVEHESGHGGRPLPDATPPQNTLIFVYGVIVVCALIGLKFVFDSYLESTRRAVREERLAHSVTSDALAAHRDEVHEALHGERSIDDAMSQLAERGRGAFPQIRPYPSTDNGAREGWNRRAPAQPTATPEPSEATSR
ncbi:MAG: hypothetical protein K1X94_02420 [Sandaracinaceae bacterium]|nr:hypothetical protein [Sandaracinaceae bacterium]